MVTYGGMAKKPVTISTSSFIFKVCNPFIIYPHLMTTKMPPFAYKYIIMIIIKILRE